MLDNVDHIKSDRSEADILYELLLKLGLDLCVPIETRAIAGKSVHSIGAGTLIACLCREHHSGGSRTLGLRHCCVARRACTRRDSTVVFRDSAFVDDITKTNLTAILDQRGLGNVRSL